jgi:exopolysaccharide production protein ExoZ
VAVFAIYLGLSFVFRAQSYIPHGGLDATLYLIENFLLLPVIFPIEPMITVAWSLSYEIFYYLAIPLVIALFDLARRSGTWRALFFSAFAAVTVIGCAIFGGPVRLVMFLSGILLYEGIKNGKFGPPQARSLFWLLSSKFKESAARKLAVHRPSRVVRGARLAGECHGRAHS